MDSAHAYKAGTQGEVQILVEQLMHLRKLLRNELSASSIKGYWVPNVVDELAAPCAAAAVSVTEKVEALKDLFTPDCVHLTSLGYTRLAKCIIAANTAAKRLLDTANAVFLLESVLLCVRRNEKGP